MSPFRISVLGLTAAIAVFASACASAASFQVWNASTASWSASGTTHLSGPIALTSVSGFSCNADFTMTIASGSASITNVVFSGASPCSAMVAYLPWPATAALASYTGPNPPFAGAPVLSPTLWNVTLSGVRLALPPFSLYCPSSMPPGGSVIAVLDAALQSGSPSPIPNRLVFKQNLGPCVFQTRTNTAPNALVANPAIRVVP